MMLFVQAFRYAAEPFYLFILPGIKCLQGFCRCNEVLRDSGNDDFFVRYALFGLISSILSVRSIMRDLKLCFHYY